MLLAPQTITLKRDKQVLSAEHIDSFIRGVTNQSVSNEQISAFAMAALLNIMSATEVVALTQAMVQSREILQRKGLEGLVVDKRSSGGVEDKVSLMLAPMAAACGLYIPMISGRGLGHTGGTLDKFDSISGYQTNITIEHFNFSRCARGGLRRHWSNSNTCSCRSQNLRSA